VALCVVLVGGGIAHRPALRANDTMTAAAVREARLFAAHHAPRRYLPLGDSDTVQQGPHVFRTCFAGPDPRRDYCLFVRTDEPALIVRVDPDQRPNATVAGPDNPGHLDGCSCACPAADIKDRSGPVDGVAGMRFLRAFVGVVGASGSIIAAGGIVLAVLSAGLAYHGWPDVRVSDAPGARATELVGAGTRTVAARRAAAVTTLPAVPIAAADRRATRTAAAGRRGVRAVRRERPARVVSSQDGRAKDVSGARPADPGPAGSTAPAGPAGSAPAATSGGGGAHSAAGGSSSSSTSGSGPGAAPSAPPAGPTAPPADASKPATPAGPGVTDAAAQAVQDTTAAAGGIVSSATSGAAQALGPIAPQAASTVAQAGQAIDDTVTGVGQVVGGILGGTRPAGH
jgi:hypothetical protein